MPKVHNPPPPRTQITEKHVCGKKAAKAVLALLGDGDVQAALDAK